MLKAAADGANELWASIAAADITDNLSIPEGNLFILFMHKRNLAHFEDFFDKSPFAGAEMRVGTRDLCHHTRKDAFLLY